MASNVDTQLNATAGEMFAALKSTLWAAINDEISLNECDIYRYGDIILITLIGQEKNTEASGSA